MARSHKKLFENQYIGHARKQDGVCTHGYCHSLGKPCNYAEGYFSEDDENSEASGSSFDSDWCDSEGSSKSEISTDVEDSDPIASTVSDGHGQNLFTESGLDRLDLFESECYACQFPFFFLENLRSSLRKAYYKITGNVMEKANEIKVAKRKSTAPEAFLDDESLDSSGSDESVKRQASSDDKSLDLPVCNASLEESHCESPQCESLEQDDAQGSESGPDSVRLLFETASWDGKLKDVLDVIDGIEDKFLRFMAHKHRVACQQDQLQMCDAEM